MESSASSFLGFLLVLFLSVSPAVSYFPPTCSKGPCTKGQFFSDPKQKCLPCDPGKTYMDKTEHYCRQCKLCSTPDPYRNQKLLRGCNLTTNSDIGCKDEYYEDTDNECEKCRTCKDNEVEKTPCARYKNRACQLMPSVKTTQETTVTSGNFTEIIATTMSEATDTRTTITNNATTTKDDKDNSTDNNVVCIVIPIVVAIAVLLILGIVLCFIFYIRRRRHTRSSNNQTGTEEENQPMNDMESNV